MVLQLVEDSHVDAQKIIERVSVFGFRSIHTSYTKDEAARSIQKNKPDIILTDYKLDEAYTCRDLFYELGIETNMPIIVITNFFKEEVFEELKEICPIQFISKSCSDLEFKQSLNYAIELCKNDKVDVVHNLENKLQKKFFIRVGDKAKAVDLNEVLFFEVDGKYLNIHLNEKKYSIRYSLSNMLKKLPNNFLRTHGSYIVNLDKIEEIKSSEQLINLGSKTIPFTRGYRKELLDKFFFA